MAFYRGKVGPCFWAMVIGELDDATVGVFVENLTAVVDTITQGEVVLDVLFDVPMPSPVQRRKIVTALRGAAALEVTSGHALAINSPIGRGLLTAINWTVRPPYPEKIFSRPADAAAWLHELEPAVDPEAVLTDMGRVAPEFRVLRW